MKFHARFNISLDVEDIKKRFINRVHNLIFLPYSEGNYRRYFNLPLIYATSMGLRFDSVRPYLFFYFKDDFYDNLHALEDLLKELENVHAVKFEIEEIIKKLLDETEIDLGIEFKHGKFYPVGVKLLDQKLVNENLEWLRTQKYLTVLEPFEKGLNHFLYSKRRPELLSDVITEMYEALEALAKIITGKDKDLSANRELFLKKLDITASYKEIFKNYISYANQFRHAAGVKTKKPNLKEKEVESFIYLTGFFIRLSM